MSKKIKNNKVQENTRTQNFVKNTLVGIMMQLFALILSFVNRTIFIKLLGNSYLSINGLFSNILNMLSFVELGFGTALIYMLYKPVANKDIKKTQSIVKFYKKTYTIIGTVMFVLGIMVIPFMKYIIKEPPQIKENLTIIYILYLIGTCSGYFFAHKSAIINANQKNYIISIYNQIGKLIQTIIQIIFLLITKNYIVYLIIQIVMNLVSNILISIKANKLYPYLTEKNIPDITSDEKNEIKGKVKSLVLYRIGPAILNGSDNLILSACVGLSSVGIYSNYYLITNYLYLFLNQITSSLETSIGNLNAKETDEKKENVFYKILYLCFFIYGIISVLLMASINDFINIWLGKEYLFNDFIVFSIVLYIYVNGIHFPCYSYRTTAALFDKMKLMPIFEVILNIVISIVLAKYLGVAGVFLGTSLAKLLTFTWSDPKILYKYLFKSNNVLKYVKKYIYYLFIVTITGGVTYYLSKLIVVNNYLTWFLRSCLLGVISIGIFVIFTFKMREFKEFSYLIKETLNKIKNKLKRKEKCSES